VADGGEGGILSYRLLLAYHVVSDLYENRMNIRDSPFSYVSTNSTYSAVWSQF
jgi:hypothetical protein